MHPGDLPPLEVALRTPERYGVLEPGRRFDAQWDPREKPGAPVDLGWIGEDARGVWLTRHPGAALADAPELWGPVAGYQEGRIDIQPSDAQELSAHDFNAKMTLLEAYRREERRQIRGGGTGGR